MKKSKLIFLCILLAAAVFSGCSSGSSASSAPASSPANLAGAAASPSASGGLTLTKAQLAQYNGQNGQQAYVAVDGVIYDVSKLPQWQGGQHNGHQAGQDLSDAFKTLPNGMARQMLSGVPVVGKLAG